MSVYNLPRLIMYSSEIRGLCSTKCSSEMFQNLLIVKIVLLYRLMPNITIQVIFYVYLRSRAFGLKYIGKRFIGKKRKSLNHSGE